jgi:hypothetical protein
VTKYFVQLKIIKMANTHNLFEEFNRDLQITKQKNDRIIKSRDKQRERIKKFFQENHPNYVPKFVMQGSYEMNTMIRTKDDTCNIDDGVYFGSNPDNVSCSTLQQWVNDAAAGISSNVSRYKECITVVYKADYNISMPVYVFDSAKDKHPYLAINGEEWDREENPQLMIASFNNCKDLKGQLARIIRFLKAWCDYKRDMMPSGFSMTILAMKHFQANDRDDISLKLTLFEIENELKKVNHFKCIVPVTPQDDLFADYNNARRDKFMSNLEHFIKDAKTAVDEEANQLIASNLWKKHLGSRFPDGRY